MSFDDDELDVLENECDVCGCEGDCLEEPERTLRPEESRLIGTLEELATAKEVKTQLEALVVKYRTALEFYADMDNQTPGTTTWDADVLDAASKLTGCSITSFNKPSKYAKDMGSLAREALKGEHNE